MLHGLVALGSTRRRPLYWSATTELRPCGGSILPALLAALFAMGCSSATNDSGASGPGGEWSGDSDAHSVGVEGGLDAAWGDAAWTGTKPGGGVDTEGGAPADDVGRSPSLRDGEGDAGPSGPGDDGDGRLEDAPEPSSCGDGVRQPHEACDDGEQNGHPSSCCTAECAVRPDGADCSDGAELLTCRRARCAQGQCVDAGPVSDGAPCIGGGEASGADTCCAGQCLAGDPTPGSCGGSCYVAHEEGKRIVIVESATYSEVGHHAMDKRWVEAVLALGHVPELVSLDYLESMSPGEWPDALVISTPTIQMVPAVALTDAVRANLEAYLAAGHGVYLQTEWQPSWFVNQWFGEWVSSYGEEFELVSTFGGSQLGFPQGCWSTYPHLVEAPLPSFWYGSWGLGTASGLDVILRFDCASLRSIQPACGDVAYAFCTPDEPPGLLVTVTDADWINKTPLQEGNSKDPRIRFLMNILARLVRARDCHAWPRTAPGSIAPLQ